ncbi:HPP family protein [Paradesertivirga mongoliensis]|uniref:HPP family protein n=1 Tax=Paradesertivirga mongoliensis TaxID=2100740 RepID=A0ABW4ZQB7_9SPHI|nr:HPP family protein [Pedobacter mongoliensis]
MKQRITRQVRKTRYVLYKETLIDLKEHIWTFLGAFTGIALIGLMQSRFFSSNDNMFLIGSFGASSVLIYGIVNSPLAQPRNLIGGHLISAFVGVSVHLLVADNLWLAAALSVSVSIVLMQMTKTLHPPGGATALIANIGSPKIHALGYYYVLSPVLTGVLLMLAVALVCNNATPNRNYPANKYWYKVWKRSYRKQPAQTRKPGEHQ